MKKLIIKWILFIPFLLAFSFNGHNDITYGFYEFSGELRKIEIGSKGSCHYLTPSGDNSYVDKCLSNCDTQENSIDKNLDNNLIIDKGIYKVSYNETYQQPNWIEYVVSNRKKS
ncbi:MAG: hypothetical protein CMC22_02105 [Flavobacteriaceae bacterium]|nr:hypothetical protein [Flavobacteriaceae bacterium]|tara:strand:+ start:1277 stop:1618 length:342 start_codon:yes stop_codon:yes gene_type:complete